MNEFNILDQAILDDEAAIVKPKKNLPADSLGSSLSALVVGKEDSDQEVRRTRPLLRRPHRAATPSFLTFLPVRCNLCSSYGRQRACQWYEESTREIQFQISS